jgi:hypothetical protein
MSVCECVDHDELINQKRQLSNRKLRHFTKHITEGFVKWTDDEFDDVRYELYDGVLWFTELIDESMRFV